MRITQRQIEGLLPGQALTARCESASEWESAKRIAQRVKARGAREDGEQYVVSQSSQELTVTVAVTNGGGRK